MIQRDIYWFIYAVLASFLLTSLLYLSIYIVPETHQAFILRQGKVLTDVKAQAVMHEPGLHFKWPFRDQVIQWDTRVQHQLVRSKQLITTEQQCLQIDYLLSWRIKDPVRYSHYFKKNADTPLMLITQLFNESLQKLVKQYSLKDLLKEIRLLLDHSALNTILTSTYGIELIDSRLVRWIPSGEMTEQIFTHMQAAQTQIATAQLLAGKKAVEAIKLQAQNTINQLFFTVLEEAETLRHQGRLAALNLYIEASKKHPRFARFYQRLQAYQGHDKVLSCPSQ
jgi:modulator of FtsH protease HflC